MDSDEEEAPLVFKRGNASNPSPKKPPAQKPPPAVVKPRPLSQPAPAPSTDAPKPTPPLAPAPQNLSESAKPSAPGISDTHAAKAPNPIPAQDDSDSDDDIPIGSRIQTAVPEKPLVAGQKNGVNKRPADFQRTQPGGIAKKPKPADDSESEEDIPLAQRVSAVPKTETTTTKTRATVVARNDKDKKKAVLTKTTEKKVVKKVVKKDGKMDSRGPGGGGGEPKWTTLEHNGVIFPPDYKPHGVKMLYKGKPVDLTPEQEEVATMFAVMRETEYATKSVFIKNFWNDWKQILGPKHTIQRMDDCDFTPIWEWHLTEKEKKKQMTPEEKKRLKEEKLQQEDKYMWAIVDEVKEKVGNFRVEPPGLFRGRGEHPKMGKLKKRIYPENITINIGKNATVPECPLPGHRWKEIRHDNTVTWLAFWNDPINQKECKYVFLAASSSLKGQSDREKYEKARKLKDYIESIRDTYTRNFDSKDPTKRQIAVATYLIDRLALRAGNEKDDDEADTVGCCSLKVEHIQLVPPASLQFDFLGKDSIRYFNTVEVEPKVYKAVGDFQKGKKTDEDLFDKLDTSKLNAHLKEIMPSLTAKVFRTYNASITLDQLLQDTVGQIVQERVADYQRANKEVAILCNHQRTVSKAHAGQMEKLEAKMADLQTLLSELEVDLDRARKGKPPLKRDSDGNSKKAQSVEALEKKVSQTKGKVEKMKLDMAVKEDLKTVALGTSKINYMDPRISIAWCKRHEVPIEKIFNKSLLAKFAWAMDVEPDFRF